MVCVGGTSPSWGSVNPTLDQLQTPSTKLNLHNAQVTAPGRQIAGVDWSWSYWQFGGGCMWLNRPMPTHITLAGKYNPNYVRYEMEMVMMTCAPM